MAPKTCATWRPMLAARGGRAAPRRCPRRPAPLAPGSHRRVRRRPPRSPLVRWRQARARSHGMPPRPRPPSLALCRDGCSAPRPAWPVRLGPVVRCGRMHARRRGARSDRRHGSRRPGTARRTWFRPFGLAQAQPHGFVIVRRNVLAPRVVHPLSQVHPPGHRVGQLHLPVAVLALARVPVDLVHAHARIGKPLRHDLAQPGARTGFAAAADRRPLRLLGPELPLGQHRTLESADPVHRQAGRVSDLLGRLTCSGSGPGSPWVATDSPLRSRTERAGRTGLAPQS